MSRTLEQILAVEKPEVVITIPNTNQSIMTFTDSTTGKTFKFYARPKQ